MNIPAHIAIIPDGNRRWAKEKGFPSFKGHQYAVEKTLPNLIKKTLELGIKYFSFWVLSTENLTERSKKEIDKLFNLMRYFLKEKGKELAEKNIKIKVIGNIKELPPDIQESIGKIIKKTKNNSSMVVTLAINYGGRDEIIRAIKKIQNSKFKIQNLNKEDLDQFLDTTGIPDPDLIIRTGGEKRLSGFMLWQCEYSELYFSNLYFPDFTPNELEKAIADYSLRQRRFGK